jgi:signal peptidase I
MPPDHYDRSTVWETLYEILKFTFLAFLIVVPFRMYVAQPFIVSGGSMTPTILPHEYLVIDIISHYWHTPERGEVIVFRYPFDPATYFVKRVIGLPGETVRIRDGIVTISRTDGTELVLDEPYVKEQYRSHESNTTVLDADEYFVLGDNRGGSSDSRVWGPLQEKFILGGALLRLYPFDRAMLRPGTYTFE